MISGILLGFATPTQLGALTVIYAIFLGIITGELKLSYFWKSTKETIVTCGALVFIIAAATPFSAILALEGIPQQLAAVLLSISDNPLVILLLVNIALLIFGMVMDTTAILLVAVPVLVPALKTLGIDPVHFGIVMVINLLIGTLTPPFGVLIFVMTEVAKVKYRPLLRQIAPFYLPLIIFLNKICKFVISSQTGIESVASLFRKEIFFVNYNEFHFFHNFNYNIVYPKKFFYKKNGKELNILEIYKDIVSEYPKNNYEENGIFYKNLNQDEILNAFKEIIYVFENGKDEETLKINNNIKNKVFEKTGLNYNFLYSKQYLKSQE